MGVTTISRAETDAANILFELGVLQSPYEVLRLDASLRDDLDLDSQELVTLAEAVSNLSIGCAPVLEQQLTQVSDVVAHLEYCRDPWLPCEAQFVLQASISMEAPVEDVFASITDYRRWPDILRHVSTVEPDRDLGPFQSFRMHIDELNGVGRMCVHSWRYVNELERIVDFAQPRPPSGFRTHFGGWRFLPISETRTELISFHAFDIEPTLAAEHAVAMIRKHIRAALTTWSAHGVRR